MASRWQSIKVFLVSGRGETFDPAPGRVMVLPPRTTFDDFGVAVDLALGRWDLAHLRQFRLADGTVISDEDTIEELATAMFSPHDVTPPTKDITSPVASSVKKGDVFEYVFDFGDDWTHVCVVEGVVDPYDVLGVMPLEPTATWGWGSLPDQYGRRWDNDDGSPDAVPEPPPVFSLPNESALERRAEALPIDMKAVRIARASGAADQLIEAMTGVDLSAALQQVGSALLVVYESSKPAVRRRVDVHLLGLHHRLQSRGWVGDDVLAAELLGALQGGGRSILPQGVTPVDLDEFSSAAEGLDGHLPGAYVNRRTGQVIPPFVLDEFSEGDPEWVDVETEDWVHVEGDRSRAAYEDMEDFARTQPPDARTRLGRAIEGKGAFSRFRREIGDLDLIGQWRTFSDDRVWGRARAELAEYGLIGR